MNSSLLKKTLYKNATNENTTITTGKVSENLELTLIKKLVMEIDILRDEIKIKRK